MLMLVFRKYLLWWADMGHGHCWESPESNFRQPVFGDHCDICSFFSSNLACCKGVEIWSCQSQNFLLETVRLIQWHLFWCKFARLCSTRVLPSCLLFPKIGEYTKTFYTILFFCSKSNVPQSCSVCSQGVPKKIGVCCTKGRNGDAIRDANLFYCNLSWQTNFLYSGIIQKLRHANRGTRG